MLSLPKLEITQKTFNKKNKDNKKDLDNKSTELIRSIVDRVDRIRNVLVHIRESRENKVILPTVKNNRNLTPYLYLIRRLAEYIAIRCTENNQN